MTGSLQYIVRKTTDAEFNAKMPYLTSSLVEAVNTCPRWGIIHSVLGKRFVTGYRQMALEAGSLMHDVFACLNFLHIGVFRELPDHMHFHASSLFGKQRWDFMWKEATKKHEGVVTVNDVQVFERLIFASISTSEYCDDPNDRTRTLANLEHCAMELMQYWLMNLVRLPIYVEDRNDCTKRIGVEISLDCVFELGVNAPIYLPGEDGKPIATGDTRFVCEKLVRCIGLADVVYQNEETGAISLGEYKTAAMMNDAWRLAFDTRHQITLYNALLQAYFGRQQDFNTILIGSAIPVRSTSAPIQHFTVPRDQENVHELINTYAFSQELITRYKDAPLTTPMFTHSCNRYFRPCSMLDLCTAAKEDQHVMLENMEVVEAASPSEQKAMLRSM
jgi:hypothetical protein